MTALRGVFLIGHRYAHHARHSGYDGFSRYIGERLKPPVRFRFFYFKRFPNLGWKIDERFGKLLGREWYSVGLMLAEVSAMKHMVTHRGCVYHLLYGDTDLWMLANAGRLLGSPVVATFHEPIASLDELRVDRHIRSLSAVILVSESQRSYFAGKIPDSRIHVVPHGVDTSFFAPADEPPLPQFITVGGHRRDFETLTAAIDIVLETRPDATFVAVGTKHGHKGPPFDHPAARILHGIDDEELRRLYRSSRAAVFSFTDATANNSLLEAMACGIPVVCTDVSGAREYMGEAGIYCRPGDPESLAAGMLRMLNAPHEALTLGDRGRERALLYDFARIAELHRDVYEAATRTDASRRKG